MEGHILYFDEGEGRGIVSDKDGNRYNFLETDWRANEKPKAGEPVNFLPDGNRAADIFTVRNPNAANKSSVKSPLQNSDIGQRISALFTGGMHNRFGVTVAVVAVISLFLPVFEFPVMGKIGLMSLGIGKILIILFAVLGVFFYGGATRIYVKVLTAAITGILFFVYFDFSTISSSTARLAAFSLLEEKSPGFFDLLQWGSFVNVGACALLLFAAFKKEYVKNEQAI